MDAIDGSLKENLSRNLANIAGFDVLYKINLRTKTMDLKAAFEDYMKELGASAPSYTSQIKYMYESELHQSCTQVSALYRKSRAFFESLPNEHPEETTNRLCRVKHIVKDCQSYAGEYFERELYELM